MAEPWTLVLPELLLITGALVVPFLPKLPRPGVANRFTVALLSIAFFLVVWLLAGDPGNYLGLLQTQDSPLLLGVYEITPYALFFKMIFLGVALLVVLVSRDVLERSRDVPEYYSLLLLAVLGMMVVSSARDLITLFVGLETSALASYTLAGIRRRSLGPTEASTKFFIIGALSAALTLYGISLLYTLAGTVNIYELATALTLASLSRPALLLAVGFLLVGFGFKVTTVPFHMWAPDVYQGAPDPVSALISGASKKMGFAAFFKVFLVGLVAVKLQWDVVVGALAVLTMTVGNLAALQQTSLKRMLAWSSIAQAGYILIALPVGTVFGLTGGLFHILTHAVMKGGAFAWVAILASHGIGDALDSYRGLSRRHPLSAATLALLLLSMAGIPPLAGFASKFVLFGGAISEGVRADNSWLLFLAIAGIVNSALSLVYYARVIRIIYVDETDEPPARLGLPATAVVVMLMLLGLVVLMGVWPQPFLDLSRTAAESLLSMR